MMRFRLAHLLTGIAFAAVFLTAINYGIANRNLCTALKQMRSDNNTLKEDFLELTNGINATLQQCQSDAQVEVYAGVEINLRRATVNWTFDAGCAVPSSLIEPKTIRPALSVGAVDRIDVATVPEIQIPTSSPLSAR